MAWWSVYALVQADHQPQHSFSVINFGAIGDGVTDDSPAFAKAWTAACEATARSVILIIPQGKTFLLKPLTFQGPCKPPSINVQISGQIVAPDDPSAFHGYPLDNWLHFLSISGLTLNGDGQIDGRGANWWKLCNASFADTECNVPRPTVSACFPVSFSLFLNGLRIESIVKLMHEYGVMDSLKSEIESTSEHTFSVIQKSSTSFSDSKTALNRQLSCERQSDYVDDQTMQIENCKKLQLHGLKFFNSPNHHIGLAGCDDAFISNLHIEAPEDSPNTDGIDIGSMTGVHIDNCVIGTGDDCIAVTNGSSNVNITRVTCGPGHGISIGSLGRGGSMAAVNNIHVRDCTFVGSSTGIRIKTWQGGSGYAKKITFENIELYNVGNPIIITQFYCPHETCANKTSAVQISHVTYKNVTGTSETEVAVNFKCSQSIGCKYIQVDLLNITSAVPGKTTHAQCLNAFGQARHSIPQVDCLK
ncbi:hypothetical protein Ancab_012027 [Ancistrocladus abbreviatus]